MPGRAQQIVTVGGRRLRVSNLAKVMYPATDTTKAEIIRYYAEIAPLLIRYAANRPATRKRWPNGVGTPGKPQRPFFQKALDDSTPEWVDRRGIEHSTGQKQYPLVNDPATLVWLAQSAALEIHVPQWQFSRTGGRRNPDRLVFDLDPGDGVGLAECAEVARWVREILTGMDLEAYPVTSGSKGIHLYAPLDGRSTSEQVTDVAHELARALASDHSDLVVSDMKKSLRVGKVLVDWSQNNGSKTTIAPYSLRGRAEPTVAVPRTWDELSSPALRQLMFDEVLERVAELGDLLQPLLFSRDAGLEPTPEHLAEFDTTPVAADRLARYREMRNREKTPEPIPETVDSASSGATFVVQEHHARRLHYDFRLEHDGVLVSWAIPKGPPLSGSVNHLAVQTEDHPLAYGAFEGTIPQGQYGAGTVSIWDAGTYDLEKWREGREVIATLTGRAGGGLGGVPRRYALIHTGQHGSENNWMIHLMDDPASRRPERVKPPRRGRRVVGADSMASNRRTSTSAPQTSAAHTSAAPISPAPISPALISPMLATAGDVGDVGEDEEWAFEMKWDGYRAIAYIDGDDVSLFSRNGKELTDTFRELVDPLTEAADGHTVVLDGEIVAFDKHGVPNFGLLQSRTGFARRGGSRSTSPVHMLAFDLLELDGRSMTDETYDVRRAALEQSIVETDLVRVPPAMDGDAGSVIDESSDLGLEGIVAKRHDSIYRPGRRTSDWIKMKHDHTQEVIVIGWQPSAAKGAEAIGSLILGVPDDHGLRFAGHVGTGFSERERREMRNRFAGMSRSTAPVHGVPREFAATARWIKPQLVGEVKFTEWTADGSLRHPSWRGWRPDKHPRDVRIE